MVNACHMEGIAVILDVVYNHLGPEGNYLQKYGPYFTDRYKTPWGAAVNFDGHESDEVRQFFIDNANYWITEFHIDGLRLDAVDGIFDARTAHFLEELSQSVHSRGRALGRRVYVMAECDRSDVRTIKPVELGGYGIDVHWNDSFHHALHVLLTNEHHGYYQDFGTMEQLGKAFREGFVFSGEYSKYRRHCHGSSSRDISACQLLVFAQNHDQVGNRVRGDRLGSTQSLDKLKLAAAVVLLSPYLPLIFMGEEYGETAPFRFFTSHGDQRIIEAVRKGRQEALSDLVGTAGDIADPQEEGTFFSSKIDITLRTGGLHAVLFRFYKELIKLRKEIRALSHLMKERMKVDDFETKKALIVRRWFAADEVFLAYHFGDQKTEVVVSIPRGKWLKILDSSSEKWGGAGGLTEDILETGSGETTLALPADSFLLYRLVREEETSVAVTRHTPLAFSIPTSSSRPRI
jgi:maltooligosyltrehalose trehalohydrolase